MELTSFASQSWILGVAGLIVAFLVYRSVVARPTGSAAERGVAGNIVNAPLAAGSGSREFREAWEGIILPCLIEFEPEFLLISAGFDAHEADPLASLRLTEEDYVWITRKLIKIADEHCQGRIVSTLEGGYDLGALARSAAVHVKTLMQV